MIPTELLEILGKNNVLTDNEAKLQYGKDLTTSYTPNPQAIVFPENQQQIIELAKYANVKKIALVPSGGRTGYSGGAVANNNEIVVSLNKMNQILEFNEGDKQIRCQPGVTTRTIQEFALERNLFYPVDFASSGSSQIGGNIATNAGGIKVIRYGLTRNWVRGLKVVTGEGKLLELNHGLIKNASGYNLQHLFIGSEGTLGIITEATLQLTNPPNNLKVALLSVPDIRYFFDILSSLKSAITLNAFEFFTQKALQHVIDSTGLRHPFSSPTKFYILFEYESDDHTDQVILDINNELLRKKLIADALISYTIQQAETFWRYREEISMSLLKHSPYKYDLAVLPSKIPDFILNANKALNKIAPGIEVIWFGHTGDGNLHLNLLKPTDLNIKQFYTLCNKSNKGIYQLVKQYNGTISAEHGIGLLKKDLLHYSKNKDEIDYMKAIKNIFDPNGIMNPGKVL